MEVYIITDGCYSDYHIIGATLDEEVAKKFVRIHSGDDPYSDLGYEPYELDNVCKDNRELWIISFDKDGNIQEKYQNKQVIPGLHQELSVFVYDYRKQFAIEQEENKDEEKYERTKYWETRCKNDNGSCRVIFFAKENGTPEYRMKIASEFRREALAHWNQTGEQEYYIQGYNPEDRKCL